MQALSHIDRVREREDIDLGGITQCGMRSAAAQRRPHLTEPKNTGPGERGIDPIHAHVLGADSRTVRK